MAFYRTYRPQKFSDIDNVAVRETLLSLLGKDKKALPHAYFFSGPKGTGKTTAARLIAKLFDCAKPQKDGSPCGTCDMCRAIAEGRNLDVLEMDAASNRGIDEIRELKSGIALAPAHAAYKVYIIDEVHMLTTEAFNALLKTLEEPPVHAVFVLATTDPQKVPATVRSRCLVVSFGRAPEDALRNALRRIVSAEHIDITDEGLRIIAGAADGSFRDAVKMLEQMSFRKGKLAAEDVRSVLALTSEESVGKFLTAFLARDIRAALHLVQDLDLAGTDMRLFLTQCLKALERELVETVVGAASGTRSVQELERAVGILSEAYAAIKGAPVPALPLEIAVVEYCDGGISQYSVAGETGETPKERFRKEKKEIPEDAKPPDAEPETPADDDDELLNLVKLTEHWKDFIEALKPYNHSVAAVLRSSRPKAVGHGIVTIEAFYPFHKEKLSELKTREILSEVIKKLFGAKIKVDIVLGKK
ncbi:DNA polymerase III subunit gamma/tau [Patescibacteria group bacterium]|nr:DNA polymerase III subunit gamma/tau [Patescibacteria group bacterium]